MIKWQRDMLLDALYYYRSEMVGFEKSIDQTIKAVKREVKEE